MKLIKETLSIDLYGTTNELKFPTLKELGAYQARLDDESVEVDNVEITKNFLVYLGMKEECFDNLQVNHIAQIMEKLGGGK